VIFFPLHSSCCLFLKCPCNSSLPCKGVHGHPVNLLGLPLVQLLYVYIGFQILCSWNIKHCNVISSTVFKLPVVVFFCYAFCQLTLLYFTLIMFRCVVIWFCNLRVKIIIILYYYSMHTFLSEYCSCSTRWIAVVLFCCMSYYVVFFW